MTSREGQELCLYAKCDVLLFSVWEDINSLTSSTHCIVRSVAVSVPWTDFFLWERLEAMGGDILSKSFLRQLIRGVRFV